MTRTLVASDDFNRADGNVGSNWLYIRLSSWQPTPIGISTNRFFGRANNTNYQVCRWAGTGTFSDDQYSAVVLTGFAFFNVGEFCGVSARCSSDTDAAADYYFVKVCSDTAGPNYTTKVGKMVNGTETTFDSTSRAWANGDSVEIECEGTTIRALKNGTLFYSTTDSSLTTGKPGIVAGSSTLMGDSWEGGDYTSGVSDTTAPILTSPTGTTTGATTASGGVTTDENNGTLYYYASTNATESAATVKASGGTQTITTIGAKSVNFTGLTASTVYYAHYVHRDTAGNDSTRVSSSSFTTSAPPSFLTDVWTNNEGYPFVAGTTVYWDWFPLGRIGSLAGITPVQGTTTIDADGKALITGITAGAGCLLGCKREADATVDFVYYEAGTAA